MSGEQITSKELSSSDVATSIRKNFSSKANHSGAKVNIHILLSKVREEKNKEKKENYIFLGLICGLIAITGILASF